MADVLNILLMPVVTLAFLALLAGAASRGGAIMAGGLVLFFATLPVLVIVTVLYAVAGLTGPLGRA
jgi:hypothetical protein